MKNSNSILHSSCIIFALQILGMVNLTAQPVIHGYTVIFTNYGGSMPQFYYLSDCEATWEEANEAAIEMGGYLATISDYVENYYIGEGSFYSTGSHGAWIGLRGEEDTYEWSNGEPVTFFNWALYPQSEPVYPDGAAVIGRLDSDFGNSWYSYPTSSEFRYIVEFPFQQDCHSSNKTYVCHNGNTICVNNSALQAHLDHGDLEGPCGPCNTPAMQALPEETIVTEGHSHQNAKVMHTELNEELDVVQKLHGSDHIHVFPNPASEQIQILLQGASQESILRILTLTGQEIHVLHLQGQQSFNIDLTAYAAGIYLIDVRSANGHYQKKIVKL